MAPIRRSMILLPFLLAIVYSTAPSQATIAESRYTPPTQSPWLHVRQVAASSTLSEKALTPSNNPGPYPTAMDLHSRSLQQSAPPPCKACHDTNSCGLMQEVGLVVVVCLVIIPVVGLSIYVQQRRVADDHVLGEALRNLPGMPKEFRYAELSRATGGFCQSNVLGKGGFGTVYRGRVAGAGEEGQEEATEVAVKTFSRETSRGDFLAELTIINRLRHRNLVRLLGWCYKNKKLLLVYEYLPNGSLDKHLFSPPDEKPLPWEYRYNILVGVASALHYLHNDYHQKVIHRDVKASNIMLDSSFNACLGDFGLARAVDVGATSSYEDVGGIPGTWGYIAPECFHTCKATSKSDVYAFGAVVLEVVCGRRPAAQGGRYRMLVDWVWTMHEEGKLLTVIDPRLENTDCPVEEAERLLLLGLACSHPISSKRPKTQTILQVLSRSIPPPVVSKKKPIFIFSPVSGDNTSMGESSSNVHPSGGGSAGFSGCYSPPMGPVLDGSHSRVTNYFTCNLQEIRRSYELGDTSTMLQSHDRSDGA